MCLKRSFGVVVPNFNWTFDRDWISTHSRNIWGQRHDELSFRIIMDGPKWHSWNCGSLFVSTLVWPVFKSVGALRDWSLWDPIDNILHGRDCLVILNWARIDGQDELLLDRGYNTAIRACKPVAKVVDVLIYYHCHGVLSHVLHRARCKSSCVYIGVSPTISINSWSTEGEEGVFRIVAHTVFSTILLIDVLHVVLLVLECLSLRRARDCVNLHIVNRGVTNEGGCWAVAVIVDDGHLERLDLRI